MLLDKSTRDNLIKNGLLGASLATIIVLSSVFLTINFFQYEKLISNKETGTSLFTIPQSIHTSFGVYYPYEAALNITPNIEHFTVASNLGNVKNYDSSNALFGPLTGKAVEKLVKNAFVVIPSNYSQIYEVYKQNTEYGVPNFITSDVILHVYHVVYDNILRSIEGDKFETMLLNLTKLMVNASRTQYEQITSESVKEAARRNLAYFLVANRLLEPDVLIDSSVKELVEAELQLIDEHDKITVSPIFEYEEDYSQYTPRGHYTRTEGLTRFLKAMMWYGRISFRLRPSFPVDEPLRLKIVSNGIYDYSKGINETRQALLIALAMTTSEKIVELWDAIYEPTVFFVGSSDDLIYSDYWEIMKTVLIEPIDPEIFENKSIIQQIIDVGLTYRNPRIVSSIVYINQDEINGTKGMRFMGQRFIPDSYIFQTLVHDNVFRRYFPTALDIFAVLGSNRSKALLINETKLYSDYLEKRDELEGEFSHFNESDWTQSLYWLWLYSLMELLTPKGEGYPVYMQADAWIDKELFTALGSWTELRHDTILYGKQSYSKKDSAPPPMDQGYVEPNPFLYARLSSLVLMTYEGLKTRNLISSILEQRLNRLHDLLINLTEISRKELEQLPLNKTEIKLIETVGEILESIVDIDDSEYTTEVDNRMAAVVDVHTDPNSKQVLEEGVGNAFIIFAINKVKGELILSRGASFSYYEFKHSLLNRLSDESWMEMLDHGSIPDLPPWVNSFIAIDSFINATSFTMRAE